MSKGPGAVQRFILDALAKTRAPGYGRHVSWLIYDWWETKPCSCGPEPADDCECEPTKSDAESVRRAIRTLERKGHVAIWWDRDEPGLPPHRVVVLAEYAEYTDVDHRMALVLANSRG